MSTTTTPPPHREPVSPAQHAWLTHELTAWQAEGIIGADAAATISARYEPSRRFTLIRLVLGLGAIFFSAGLIWLVASNLDRFSPLVRLVIVVVIWLGSVVLAEGLATRRERGGDFASPVVEAARMLVTAGMGAVIFQGAQSLQVTTPAPDLLGWWALAALLYAYAVHSRGPLVVAVMLLAFWYIATGVRTEESTYGVVLSVLVGCLVATGAAVLHQRRWLASFAPVWPVAAVALGLIGLFVAALPQRVEVIRWTWPALIGGLVLAVVLAGAALVVGRDRDRIDVAVSAGVVLAGVGLVLWQPAGIDELFRDGVTPSGWIWLRVCVAVVIFLAAASWWAALGVRHDLPLVTIVATLALVLFITVQSFAVFAPIISGAALFLTVGAIMLATGYLADRGRRRLVAAVEEEERPAARDESEPS